jgi:signal transduction histidine kinase
MESGMTDIKNIFHSFGISDLLNASTSGLILFKKDRAPEKEAVRYVCTVDNESARQLTGLKSLTGLTWQEIVGGGESNLDPLIDRDVEVQFKAPNVWCRASNVVVDENHFMCTLTDITLRKQIEERENRVLDILNDAEKTMRFGSWVWEMDTLKNEWSAGMYALMGYTADEIPNLTSTYEFYLSHVHPDDVEMLRNAVEGSFERQTSFNVEYRLITPAGQEKYIVSRGQFIPGDETRPALSIGSAFDLTPIRAIQHKLERKVDELNRSNFDLEQFAYVASHDLQEPLRKIVSFGERLEKRSQGALDEEMSLYLDRILNATRRMQDMINNLLEFSRVARSKAGFVPSDLNTIIGGTLSDLEIAIQNKNASITIEALPDRVEVIPTQMSQLFNNLLSNSLKFTQDDRQPEINIKSDRLSKADQLNYGLSSRGQYIRITFSDNGIGFENNDSSRIFTLFQRLRGRSEFEGAGIGLAVCKKVVENHSGIIMASGKTGQGAVFTIVLPLTQS